MSDFYIYLYSNLDGIFKNTCANFKTKLFKRLTLTEDYEVGLAEISYTFALKNLFNDEFIKLKYIFNDQIKEKIFIIKAGYYTIETLNNIITKTIQIEDEYKYLPKIQLTEDEINPRFKISTGLNDFGLIFILFSDNLYNILGIEKSQLEFLCDLYMQYFTEDKELFEEFANKIELVTQTPYDITGGFHTLFVYCDLIKPNLVGDTNTQLLKVVEIPNDISYGEQVHLIYPHIQYFPIQNYDVETIEIDIKDDSGVEIPFTFAKNLVVLHVRKKNNKRNLK